MYFPIDRRPLPTLIPTAWAMSPALPFKKGDGRTLRINKSLPIGRNTIFAWVAGGYRNLADSSPISPTYTSGAGMTSAKLKSNGGYTIFDLNANWKSDTYTCVFRCQLNGIGVGNWKGIFYKGNDGTNNQFAVGRNGGSTANAYIAHTNADTDSLVDFLTHMNGKGMTTVVLRWDGTTVYCATDRGYRTTVAKSTAMADFALDLRLSTNETTGTTDADFEMFLFAKNYFADEAVLNELLADPYYAFDTKFAPPLPAIQSYGLQLPDAKLELPTFFEKGRKPNVPVATNKAYSDSLIYANIFNAQNPRDIIGERGEEFETDFPHAYEKQNQCLDVSNASRDRTLNILLNNGPVFSNDDPWTFIWRCKTTDSAARGMIAGDSTSSNYVWMNNTSTLRFVSATAQQYQDNNITDFQSALTTLAITSNGAGSLASRIRFFQDSHWSQTNSASTGFDFAQFLHGFNNDDNIYKFVGFLEFVYLFNRELSVAEVKRIIDDPYHIFDPR